MQSLFFLIKQYRVFLVFFILEVTSLWLVVRNNVYQNATFFNSSNIYTGTLLSWKSGVTSYFLLGKENKRLAQENANLHLQLSQYKQKTGPENLQNIKDTAIVNKYTYTVAKVVNNSTHKANNYITINKGKLDGIKPGMGVVSSLGIVGKVRACSNHFSTIVSLLHTEMTVSAKLQRNDELGTIQWDGKVPRYVKLLDIPNYLKVKRGDTVVTSGYNSIYPSFSHVGVIKNVKRKGHETFYDIDVEVSTQFNSLNYVYVVQNKLQQEQDSIETKTFEKINE